MSNIALRKSHNQLLTYLSEQKELVLEDDPENIPSVVMRGTAFAAIPGRLIKLKQFDYIGDQPLTGNWKASILGMPIVLSDKVKKSDLLVMDYFEAIDDYYERGF